jgi:hypothetical protein
VWLNCDVVSLNHFTVSMGIGTSSPPPPSKSCIRLVPLGSLNTEIFVWFRKLYFGFFENQFVVLEMTNAV